MTSTTKPSAETVDAADDSGSGEGQGFSRRELLNRAGAVGAAIAFSGGALDSRQGSTAAAGAAVEILAAPTDAAKAAPVREGFNALTAGESDILEAIVARLIPTDEHGPGAAEARAAHYIDRALTGPLAFSLEAYSAGLAAIDTYAKASKGAPFSELPATDQDAVLSDMEKNVATGFTPTSSAFFNLLRTHTIEGTFGDPHHGGNAGFVGWDLIDYPGIRIVATSDEQRMDILPTPNHKSAYDYPMFTKRRTSRDH